MKTIREIQNSQVEFALKFPSHHVSPCANEGKLIGSPLMENGISDAPCAFTEMCQNENKP